MSSRNILFYLIPALFGWYLKTLSDFAQMRFQSGMDLRKKKYDREDLLHATQIETLLSLQEALVGVYDVIRDIAYHGVTALVENKPFDDYPKELLERYFEKITKLTMLRFRVLDPGLDQKLNQFYVFATKIQLGNPSFSNRRRATQNEVDEYSDKVLQGIKDRFNEVQETLGIVLREELTFGLNTKVDIKNSNLTKKLRIRWLSGRS